MNIEQSGQSIWPEVGITRQQRGQCPVHGTDAPFTTETTIHGLYQQVVFRCTQPMPARAGTGQRPCDRALSWLVVSPAGIEDRGKGNPPTIEQLMARHRIARQEQWLSMFPEATG